MPELIREPSRVAAAGQPPKLIDEYVGRANTGQGSLSIAHMRSPSGWAEPGQRPEFDEFTIVLRGAVVVESPGDRVMAMTHFPDGAGGYAELAVIDAALAAPISSATSFADAAATPLAAGTAYVVLARLGLPAGSRLLVLGASGGVGLFLLQVAAAAGITTIGAGRQVMHAQMSDSGATACIDYTCEDVASRALALAGGPVDAIADLVGGRLAQTACPALRSGGQIAAIATPDLDLDPLLDANITFHGVLLQDDGDRTRALAGLLDRRALRPVVSHVLPLAAAAEAHRIVEGGHPGGKVVLDVASS